MRGRGMLISVYRGPSYSNWKMGSNELESIGMAAVSCDEVGVGAESSVGKGDMVVVASMVCDSPSLFLLFFARLMKLDCSCL